MEITPEQKNLINTTILAITKDFHFFFFQIPGYSSRAWAGWPLEALRTRKNIKNSMEITPKQKNIKNTTIFQLSRICSFFFLSAPWVLLQGLGWLAPGGAPDTK